MYNTVTILIDEIIKKRLNHPCDITVYDLSHIELRDLDFRSISTDTLSISKLYVSSVLFVLTKEVDIKIGKLELTAKYNEINSNNPATDDNIIQHKLIDVIEMWLYRTKVRIKELWLNINNIIISGNNIKIDNKDIRSVKDIKINLLRIDDTIVNKISGWLDIKWVKDVKYRTHISNLSFDISAEEMALNNITIPNSKTNNAADIAEEELTSYEISHPLIPINGKLNINRLTYNNFVFNKSKLDITRDVSHNHQIIWLISVELNSFIQPADISIDGIKLSIINNQQIKPRTYSAPDITIINNSLDISGIIDKISINQIPKLSSSGSIYNKSVNVKIGSINYNNISADNISINNSNNIYLVTIDKLTIGNNKLTSVELYYNPTINTFIPTIFYEVYKVLAGIDKPLVIPTISNDISNPSTKLMINCNMDLADYKDYAKIYNIISSVKSAIPSASTPTSISVRANVNLRLDEVFSENVLVNIFYNGSVISGVIRTPNIQTCYGYVNNLNIAADISEDNKKITIEADCIGINDITKLIRFIKDNSRVDKGNNSKLNISIRFKSSRIYINSLVITEEIWLKYIDNRLFCGIRDINVNEVIKQDVLHIFYDLSKNKIKIYNGLLNISDINQLILLYNSIIPLTAELSLINNDIVVNSNSNFIIIDNYQPNYKFKLLVNLNVIICINSIYINLSGVNINYIINNQQPDDNSAKCKIYNRLVMGKINKLEIKQPESKWKTMLTPMETGNKSDHISIDIKDNNITIMVNPTRMYIDQNSLPLIHLPYNNDKSTVTYNITIYPIKFLLDLKLRLSSWLSAEKIDISTKKIKINQVTLSEAKDVIAKYFTAELGRNILSKYITHIKGTPLYINSLIMDIADIFNLGKDDVIRRISANTLTLISRWLVNLNNIIEYCFPSEDNNKSILSSQPAQMSDGIMDMYNVYSNIKSAKDIIYGLNLVITGLRNQLDKDARIDMMKKYT